MKNESKTVPATTPYKAGDLTSGTPGNTLFRFMIPLIAGAVLQQVYNLADSVIVGQFVGAGALAAVGSSGTIFYMFNTVSNGFASGMSVVAGQLYGAGKKRELRDIIATAIWFIAIASLVVSVAGVLLCEKIMLLINTPADVLADSVTYLTVIMIGFVFIFLASACAQFLNALGDSKTPFYCGLGAGILNIVLNLIFVVGLKMGVMGVALPTIISLALQSIALFILVLRRVSKISGGEGKLSQGFGKYSGQKLGLIIKMGLPSAAQGLVLSISSVLMQSIINGFGSVYMAAYVAASKIEQMLAMPVWTLYGALSNFTAQNIGAKRMDRVKSAYHTSNLWSVVFCGVMCVVIYLFGGGLISMFVNADANAMVIATGQQHLRIAVFSYFPMCFMFMTEGVLRGAGDMLAVSIVTTGGMIFRMTAAFLLAPILGFYAVAVSFLFSYGSESILAYLRYRFGNWQKHRVVSDEPEPVTTE